MTDQQKTENTPVEFSDFSKKVLTILVLAIATALGLGGTGAITSYELATNPNARPNAWGKTDALEQEARLKDWVIQQLNARVSPVSDSITVILGRLNAFHEEHNAIVKQNALIIERQAQQEAQCKIVTARDDELSRRIVEVNLDLQMEIDRVHNELYRHIDDKQVLSGKQQSKHGP